MNHSLRILVPVAGYLLCGYVWFSGVHVVCMSGGRTISTGGSGLTVLLVLLVTCALALVSNIWSLTGILRAREWLIFIGIGVAGDVVFSLVHAEWLALVPPTVYALNLARQRLETSDRVPVAAAFLLSTWLPVLVLAAVAHTLTDCTSLSL